MTNLDERTDNVARLYRIIIDPSRNILGSRFDDPKTSPSLEQSLPDGKFTPLDKVLAVDLSDVLRSRQAQNIAESPQVFGVPGEAIATNVRLGEAKGLDHRAHRAVENQNAGR